MINTKKNNLERLLQEYRFMVVKPFIKGDTLDFGGNEGELKPLVSGDYTVVNYDRSGMFGKKYDTVTLLAVIEHIEVNEVYKIFSEFKTLLKNKGIIFITTPTIFCMPVLEILSRVGLTSRENILEHKHYWSKRDLYKLAEKTGFKVKKYRKFQLGLNQLAIFEHLN